MNKAQKVKVLETLSGNLSSAKSATVVNYQGLATKDLQVLRSELNKVGGTFTVVKNTLLKLALEKTQDNIQDIPANIFDGPTAVVLAKDDEVAPLQSLAKFAKEKSLPKFKFGIFDNAIIDSEKLDILSKLPNKATLYGQLVGTLVSPVYGLVGTLSSNMQSLVYILGQRVKQQEAVITNG